MSSENPENNPENLEQPQQPVQPETVVPVVDHTHTPEQVEVVEVPQTPEAPENYENLFNCVGPENQSFLERMSEKGKSLANRMYESLYAMPIINRIVGKLEISYNEYWAGAYEKKQIAFKEGMDSIDSDIKKRDDGKIKFESAIENLKKQGMPGAERLALDVRKIEDEKRKLLDKKNELNSEAEANENKKKIYTNKRDAIADKLIGRYDEKLKPLEAQLEDLKTQKDEVDLLSVSAEIRHKEVMRTIEDDEKRKAEIMSVGRSLGWSDKRIAGHEAIKGIEDCIAQKRERIRIEKENLTRQKIEVDKKIAKKDAEANPYRDKREEFVRVKDRRPIDIEMKKRQQAKEFTGRETVSGNTRTENAPEEVPYEEAPQVEVAPERRETRETAGQLINEWNAYLKNRLGNETPGLINQVEFQRLTRLSANHPLEASDLKKVLPRFYKIKKLPVNQFSGHITTFLASRTTNIT
jgi:hypothetical protein